MATSNRLITWVAIIMAAMALLAVASLDGGGAETDSERIQRLSDSFACPQCRGESVSESNAAVSANIRQFIADEVSAGSSDEEIRNELLRGYGASVLLNPPAEGLAALLWILPVLLVVAGAVGFAMMIDRRRSGSGRAALSSADREMVGRARAAFRRKKTEP